jgi:hypothetical protein
MFIRQMLRVAIAAAVFVCVGQESRAAFIVGSVAFDFILPQATPTSGNLDTASGITFPTPAFNVNASRTGDYLSVLSTGSFGDSTVLNFSGTALNSTLNLPYILDFNPGNVGGVRTFTAASGSLVVRTFSPTGRLGADIFGTVSFNGFDATPGILTLSFNQTNGPGTAISGSGTLGSPFPPIAAVPVPATFVLASLGGIMMAGARGLRRRFA